MPSIFKLLSPLAILIGLIVAAGAIIVLWPLPAGSMATIGLAIFLLTAGTFEVIMRIVRGSSSGKKK